MARHWSISPSKDIAFVIRRLGTCELLTVGDDVHRIYPRSPSFSSNENPKLLLLANKSTKGDRSDLTSATANFTREKEGSKRERDRAGLRDWRADERREATLPSLFSPLRRRAERQAIGRRADTSVDIRQQACSFHRRDVALDILSSQLALRGSASDIGRRIGRTNTYIPARERETGGRVKRSESAKFKFVQRAAERETSKYVTTINVRNKRNKRRLLSSHTTGHNSIEEAKAKPVGLRNAPEAHRSLTFNFFELYLALASPGCFYSDY